jgi:fucose permease
VSCAAIFVFGMILGLPGTVLGQPETVRQFGLTLADRGMLISSLFFGLLLGSLASGPLVDTIGQRVALALSSGLVAICLPLFAVASNAALAAVSLGAIGLASATVNTASNALSSELFPEERGRRMNGLAVMVGLGGLAMPTATVLASAYVSWRVVVIGGGGLSAIVAMICARMQPVDEGSRLSALGSGFSVPSKKPISSLTAFRQVTRQPGFVWFCLLILLGGGNEASMAGWTSSFLLASGFSAVAATWALSFHWLGLILSRVLFSKRVDQAKVAVVERSAVAGAILVLGLVTAGSPFVLAIGPFAIGMAIALVMPTSLALAGERMPGNPGTLFGVLLTLAQVGGMVLPASIGLVAERAGVRPGMAILVGSCVAIAWIVRRLSSTSYQIAPKAG